MDWVVRESQDSRAFHASAVPGVARADPCHRYSKVCLTCTDQSGESGLHEAASASCECFWVSLQPITLRVSCQCSWMMLPSYCTSSRYSQQPDRAAKENLVRQIGHQNCKLVTLTSCRRQLQCWELLHNSRPMHTAKALDAYGIEVTPGIPPLRTDPAAVHNSSPAQA